MRISISIGLIIILISLSCSSEREIINDIKDVVITLERTVCFGTCPAYFLRIKGDGSVFYEGRDFVKVKGEVESTISREDLKKLVDAFYEIDYFSLEDEYTANVTDLPTTITSISIGDRSKRVVNYYGAPEKLIQLEKLIDSLTNSAHWIGDVD